MLHRHKWIALTLGTVFSLSLFFTSPALAQTTIPLSLGEHLFIDDYLIESKTAISRIVLSPTRSRSTPVIGSIEMGSPFRNFNFSAGVIRDPQTNMFRMWYNKRETTGERVSATTTSADGITWGQPQTIPNTIDAIFSTVIDRGPTFSPTNQRYFTVLGDRTSLPPRWYGELFYSADGIVWPNTPLRITANRYGEVWDPYLVPNTNQFGLLHRYNSPHTWTDIEGVTHTNTALDPNNTRLYANTKSLQLTSFPASTVVFAPDTQDSGETQFYNVSNIIKRGDYLVGMLSILRDDLKASGTPSTMFSLPVYGTGYTVLIWSTDGGNTWKRDRHTNPYLSPDPNAAAWDHAITWIDSILPVNDELYLYYGGYKYGHKSYNDRGIGMIMAKKDRFVRQLAGSTPGKITTKPVTFNGNSLSLNVAVDTGTAIVRLLSPTGAILSTCAAVSNIDAISVPTTCNPNLGNFRNQPVKFEFSLTQGSLFAFDIADVPTTPTPTTSPSPDPDFDNDGRVDMDDYFTLQGAVNTVSCLLNLTQDCRIDLFDINYLIKRFGL